MLHKPVSSSTTLTKSAHADHNFQQLSLFIAGGVLKDMVDTFMALEMISRFVWHNIFISNFVTVNVQSGPIILLQDPHGPDCSQCEMIMVWTNVSPFKPQTFW